MTLILTRGNRLISALAIVATIISSLFVTSPSASDRPSVPDKKSVLIRNKTDSPLVPQLISTTSDGGLIVAGGSPVTKENWATKFDAANQSKWSYFRIPSESERLAVQSGSESSKYRGIAELPNHDLLLCADRPSKRGDPPGGIFVTHLDAQGKFLTEFDALEKNPNNEENYLLLGCAAWGDLLAVVAVKMNWPGHNNNNTVLTSTYSIIFYNSNGSLKRKTDVEALTPGFIPDRDGFGLKVIGDALLISMTNNSESELFTLNSSGKLEAHRKIAGRQLLIRGQNQKFPFKIFAPSNAEDGLPPVISILSRDLSVIKSVQGTFPRYFVTRTVLESADGSLLLFGSNVNLFGARLSTGIRQLEMNLSGDRKIDIAGFKTEEFSIMAASVLENGKGYAYAVSGSSLENENSKNFVTKGSVTGAIVIFVKQER